MKEIERNILEQYDIVWLKYVALLNFSTKLSLDRIGNQMIRTSGPIKYVSKPESSYRYWGDCRGDMRIKYKGISKQTNDMVDNDMANQQIPDYLQKMYNYQCNVLNSITSENANDYESECRKECAETITKLIKKRFPNIENTRDVGDATQNEILTDLVSNFANKHIVAIKKRIWLAIRVIGIIIIGLLLGPVGWVLGSAVLIGLPIYLQAKRGEMVNPFDKTIKQVDCNNVYLLLNQE